MTDDIDTATSWVAQSVERQNAINLRAIDLLRETTDEHFRRLLAEWSARDDGPIPTRAEAEMAARSELETLCRGLGRLAALAPYEAFPTSWFTTSSNGGW